MNPVAFSIGNFAVRWYGILISSGMIIALLLSWYNCKRKNLNFDDLVDVFLISLPCAIIGARAYYVIFEFDSYRDNLINIFNIRQGGLAIHGGLIGAFMAAAIMCRVKKMKFLQYADLVAPAIILAQGIGRWGNFMNGEAHGGPVSYEFISRFPEFIQKGMNIGGVYYNPTFLYESLWNFTVFIVLMFILYKKSNKESGIVISSYIALYSLGRVFIEGLRTDSLMIGNIRVAQLISLTGITFGVACVIFILIRKKHIYMIK